MKHGVAALGLCSWDRFVVTDTYPGPGEYAIVRHQFEQAGGTTANTCAALAKLGVEVTIVSRVGEDTVGERLIASLTNAGCDARYVEHVPGSNSDSGIIVISGEIGRRDRTIFWIQGVKPAAGMTFPVDDMLAHEWLMLDVDDSRLRKFFLDLPAHRSPRTKLFGTMTYLVEMSPAEGWSHAMRHDVVVGNVRELLALTQSKDLESAIHKAQHDIRQNACRELYISDAERGAYAITRGGVSTSHAFEIEATDTTGAGDAFAAGVLWGLLDHCDPETILLRANALGGLACRALGARAGLPTRDEVTALMTEQRRM